MRNFFENLVKTIGFSDDGFIGVVYGIYLLVTKKLPDSVESNLAPQEKRKYVIVQVLNRKFSTLMNRKFFYPIFLSFFNSDRKLFQPYNYYKRRCII